MLITGALYYWVKYTLARDQRDLWIASILFGLAGLTKYSALPIGLPLLAISFVSQRTFTRRSIIHFSIAALLVIAPPGMWLLRNYNLFGELFPFYQSFTAEPLLHAPLPEFYRAHHVFEMLFYRFFCFIGWVGDAHDEAFSLLTLPAEYRASYVFPFVAIMFLAALHYTRPLFQRYSVWIAAACWGLGLAAGYGLDWYVFHTQYIPLQVGFMLMTSATVLCLISHWTTNIDLNNKPLYLAAVSYLILLFFSAVFLVKLYDLSVRVGYLWGAQGRYFFPFIGFMCIGYLIPLLSAFRHLLRWTLLVPLYFQVLEIIFWFTDASTFYVR